MIWNITEQVGGEYQSGQLGRTVNPLTYVFTGSNPVSPTIYKWKKISGSSSVGRAAAFQAAGRGFEPRLPLYAFYKHEVMLSADVAQG